jgi:hypothetical protein
MPWVYKSPTARLSKFRAKLRRWAFDHSSELVELEVGGIVIASIFLAIVMMSKLV